MNTIPGCKARLILNTGGVRRIVPVESLPFTIGRGADRDLTLAHPQISRDHACIERDAEGYTLRDLGSLHGTFVNGAAIAVARLRPQDRITLGVSPDILLFEEEEDSSARSLITQLSQAATGPGSRSDLETLSLFLRAAQSLGSYGAAGDVLRAMLEYTIRLTGAERGFVFLGETPGAFRLECGQRQDGAVLSDHPAISWSIVRDAALSQLDFILSDTRGEAARESIVLNAIRSVVAIPLRGQSSGRLLGLLYLDSRTESHDFTRTSQDILHAIAHQAATLIENLRMLEAEREAAFLRRELEIAASIQRQMIPQTLPEFPGIRLNARTVPCAGVGGDFYDVIPIPDGFVAIVGDVCGKGIPAALLASMVQGMFHAQVTMQIASELSLVDAVQSVNSFVCARAPGEKYVTLAVLRYTHSGTGEARVELVNGGHVSPLIVHADGRIETITDGDLPVGLIEAARFHAIPLTLAAGDRIVLLSDGITEAENADGVPLGFARLDPYLTQSDPVAALFSALDEFCQGVGMQDDQTVLTIERTG